MLLPISFLLFVERFLSTIHLQSAFSSFLYHVLFLFTLYSFDRSYNFTLKDRANEIYKKVEDQKSTRGRNQAAILAACLYIACRQEDKPRTVKGNNMTLFRFSLLLKNASPFILCKMSSKSLSLKIEICSVANGATKKEIGRAKEYIVKQLELEMGQSVEIGTIHAGDFMVSFFMIQRPLNPKSIAALDNLLSLNTTSILLETILF